MEYLDANLFIFAEIDPYKKGEDARTILRMLGENELVAVTGSLTIDEVVWKIKKHADFATAIAAGRKMFEFPNLSILSVDSGTVFDSFNFMEKYKIHPRDAIHVACMLNNNIGRVITEDPDFEKIKEIEVFKFSDFLKGVKR